MSQVMDHLDDVGPGWHEILLRLHYALSELDPAYEVVQVKEKFGGLRVYLRSETPDMTELICESEGESLRTCERCGQPGEPRGPGWIKTFCEEHRGWRPFDLT